jgi:hypothetical protein
VISNTNSPIENERIQHEILEEKNKDRIDLDDVIPVRSTAPVQDVVGMGLNTRRQQ